MLRAIMSGNPITIVISLFSYAIILLIATPVHECAHALVAYWLGDDTAARQGRISLNPLAHFDPVGTISILLFGIGWAKPVPVQPYRCRKVKTQKAAMALTAAAGPVSNVLMALVFMVISKLVLRLAPATMVTYYVFEALFEIVSINLSLGVFNLLPIPPFDGSRLFLAFLPSKYYFGIMKYEEIIKFVLLGLLFTGALQIPFGILADWIYSGLDFVSGFLGSMAGLESELFTHLVAG
ncbi:MAG: site-2 protease family protein [Bacteroides sp.]|nr:site-2 protease family protein [Eubacterium sp.]MCM1419014.1 site-2 protease family protein [Roseburia sp.]MCM1462864.1 site-2 protease family protein [Bacteroides sp.]